jgi:hypothetical protein
VGHRLKTSQVAAVAIAARSDPRLRSPAGEGCINELAIVVRERREVVWKQW